MGIFALTAMIASSSGAARGDVFLIAVPVTAIAAAIVWPLLYDFLPGRRFMQRESVAAFNRKLRPGSMRRDRAKQIALELDPNDYASYHRLVPRIEESDIAKEPGEEPDPE